MAKTTRGWSSSYDALAPDNDDAESSTINWSSRDRWWRRAVHNVRFVISRRWR